MQFSAWGGSEFAPLRKFALVKFASVHGPLEVFSKKQTRCGKEQFLKGIKILFKFPMTKHYFRCLWRHLQNNKTKEKKVLYWENFFSTTSQTRLFPKFRFYFMSSSSWKESFFLSLFVFLPLLSPGANCYKKFVIRKTKFVLNFKLVYNFNEGLAIWFILNWSKAITRNLELNLSFSSLNLFFRIGSNFLTLIFFPWEIRKEKKVELWFEN